MSFADGAAGHRTGATDIGAEGAHDANDAAVVSDDRVGVGGVAVTGDELARIEQPIVIAVGPHAATAEQDVGAVGPLLGSGQREEVGTAAEDVVLALTAEGDVVATAAFDVILTIGGGVERRDQVEIADQVTRTARGRAVTGTGGFDTPVGCARSAVMDRAGRRVGELGLTGEG